MRYGPAMTTPVVSFDSRTVSRSVEVAAPAERVWDLITDLPGMGAFSPENSGGRWQSGATGPAVGAVFRGTNEQGRRRWATQATVVTYEPVRSFAFEVRAVGKPVARWSYDVVATGGSCTVTETWLDRRGWLIVRTGTLISGITDRCSYNALSMEQTLARIKQHAER